MKKITMVLMGLTLLAGTACKKDSNDTNTGGGTPAKTCLIAKEEETDGSYTSYVYNSMNQMTSSTAFTASDTTTFISTAVYSGNTATVTNNGDFPTIITYYLNANKLADSAVANVAGLAEIRIFNKYNSAGEPTETRIVGEVFGTSIDETNTNIYANGNKVKETSDDGTDVTVTNYEYYLDKMNLSAASEQSQEFNKANKNLLKKATYDDGSFDSYTYEYDADGKVTKVITTNSDSGATTLQVTWTCK